MDAIFIEGLRLVGKHGVHERERKREQEFLIDIRAELDTSKAGESDDLADTADYGHFARVAQEAVERNSFYLIERLAQTIADGIRRDERIKQVSVTVRKPEALENGVPGVTVIRTR